VTAAALRGIIPILAMPFTATGEVDEDSLRREVDWAIAAGVDGLGLALASEMLRLSERERSLVTRLCAAQARGRVPLVVNVSAESGYLAAELARRAEADGGTALMLLPPVFEVSGLDGLRAFFDEVARATSLPIVLQDIPTARIPAPLAASVADAHPGRFAFKAEVSPTPVTVEWAVRELGGRMPVFGGAGGLLFYSELLRGAAGTMPGCVLPELFVRVWAEFRAGDRSAARQTFPRFLPFLVATTVPGRVLEF
jgi:dihydrodipicolinate synthase/N-acetylneuraminate lyase